MLRTISIAAAAVALLFVSPVRAQLTTRQMRTVGTPTSIPAASASNGASDSVARVDHAHTCSIANASQAGCVSAADWSKFNGKESVLTFSDGLTRATNSVACDDAALLAKGCVTSAAQTIGGEKTFAGGIRTQTITGNSGLNIASSGSSALTFDSASSSIGIGDGTTSIAWGPNSAGKFSIDLSSKDIGESTLAVTNTAWTSEASGFTTDLDIEHGDLEVCSVQRIACDGSASLGATSTGALTADEVYSGYAELGSVYVDNLSVSTWPDHSHTNSTTGGKLSIASATTGTLTYDRGGTGGVNYPYAGRVAYGTGGAISYTAQGTAGKPLLSNATNAPYFGTLGYSGGGTGSTSAPTAGGVVYGTGSEMATTSAGSSGQLLKSNGSSAPSWDGDTAWTYVSSFYNSWTNYDSTESTWAHAKYRKTADGTVYLTGLIKSGTIGSIAFYLPAGYRPGKSKSWVVESNGEFSFVRVAASGAVTPALGNNAFIYLDLSFVAEL